MNAGERFTQISWALLAFLLLNLALIDTMAPLALFVLFTDALGALPVPALAAVGAAAWVASAPGVAAAFAASRDSQSLRSVESAQARRRRIRRTEGTDAIAAPYWQEAEDTRVIRPYFRTYIRLFRRSLAVSVLMGGTAGALAVAALALMAAGAPLPVAVTLFALAAYALLAHVVALDLVVEFPRARTLALTRQSLFLLARSWPLAALELLILAGYAYALVSWPWVVLLLAQGLVLFFLHGCVQAIATPVRDLMIREELGAAPEDGEPEEDR